VRLLKELGGGEIVPSSGDGLDVKEEVWVESERAHQRLEGCETGSGAVLALLSVGMRERWWSREEERRRPRVEAK